MLVFPESYDWYITSEARELKRNVDRLRALFQKVVNERKLEMQKTDYTDACDLLSTLL